MVRYIFSKIIQSILTLLLVSVVIFAATRALGDPSVIYVPQDATEEMRQAYIKNLGLDKPAAEQYKIYLTGLLKGDMGTSFSTKGSVSELIFNRLPNTIKLALVTIIVAVLAAFISGLISAVFKNKLIDKICLILFAVGQSTPVFLAMMLAVEVFSTKLGWLPPAGMEAAKSYIMPAGILGLVLSTVLAPILRNSMIETLNSEYIKMARLKGLPEHLIILKHGLKNAVTPVVSMLTVMFSHQLTGTMIVESIFAWPGIGTLAYQSIMQRDYPTIQGLVIIMTIMVIFVNIVSDVLHAGLDARIRSQV